VEHFDLAFHPDQQRLAFSVQRLAEAPDRSTANASCRTAMAPG
jgi:hypothetical protein